MGKKSKAKASFKSKKKDAGGGGRVRNRNGGNKTKHGIDPFGEGPSANTDTSPPIQSIYHVYKTATLRFKEQLSSLVPSSIFESDYVQSFLDASEYVKDNGIAVDASLLRNLRVAINVRKKYSRRLADGGDGGHAYFLLVLNYCMQVLKRCEVIDEDASGAKTAGTNVADDDGEDPEERAFFNRYGALSLEENLDGESDNEGGSGEDHAPAIRPEPPSDGKTYSSADLMSFPDRAKCMFLFDTMAYHAAKLAIAMRNLKGTMRMEATGDYPTNRVGREITVMGFLAKQMMLDVERLECELYVECPDLGESSYRVLAVCFLSPYINMISQNVRMHSPIASKFKDGHAVALFGDIVEGVFRCHTQQQMEAISTRFSKRWKLAEHWKMKNMWMTSLVARLALMSLRTELENKIYKEVEFREDERPLTENIPEWMVDEKTWVPISRDRSILNTMRLLDMFGSFQNTSPKKHMMNDLMHHFLNNMWDEESNPASSIRGDMDSVLVVMFLSIMFSKWRFSWEPVPMEKHMLPVVNHARNWTISQMKPGPPLALVFSLHCMLVSIIELQGDGDVKRIASIAKKGFSKFMSQTEEHLNVEVPCPPDRESCLKSIIELKRVTEQCADWKSAAPILSIEGFDLLFWNPLCSGLFLGYTNVCLSLRVGLFSMRTGRNAHSILHIYNALKQRGLVDENLPVLSAIDGYFDKLKAFWNGWEKPKRGKFTYRFHLSMGAPNEFAAWEQERQRHKIKGGQEPGPKPKMTFSQLQHNKKTSKRFSELIDAADVSDTYKRLCLANFEDLEKTINEDPNAPKHLKVDPSSPFPMPFQVFDAKTYLLFTAFTSEIDMLRYNMVAVDTVFCQFLYETFNATSSEGITRLEARKDLPVSHEGDIRTLVNMHCTEEILAGLDFNEDDDAFAYLGEAFEEFFYNLDLDRVLLCGYEKKR